MLKLRPYQEEAIKAIEKTFKKNFRQYIELPTGAGKTVTFLSFCKKNNYKTMIIVPSVQLMHQVYQSALKMYHPIEISRKGDRYVERPKTIHICIANSLRDDYLEKITQTKFDLIVIDEAHHSQSKIYIRFIKTYEDINSKTKILGVTATPDRTDGKMLEEILHLCSYSISISDLIQQKYLSDIEGYRVKTGIDISEIDNHNGDFSLNLLYKKLSTSDRNGIVLECYKKHLSDRKTLIFCINVQHSKDISNLFNKNGISCAHIDGKMKSDQRAAILNGFLRGEIQVVCNCHLLTEGFDEPSIDGIILARPTGSRSLFTQMIGRGLRIFPNKLNCRIVDVVDNHKNLKSFKDLIENCHRDCREKDHFESFGELKDHVEQELIRINEISIERAALLGVDLFEEEMAVETQIDYLKKHKILYFEPLTLEEAAFLVWFDHLQKKFNKSRK